MNKDEFVIHSGGALGADTFFGEIGASLGFNNTKHYYFEGFKTPNGNTPLSLELVDEAKPFVVQASKALGRKFPTSKEYVDMLLLRNYFQVKNSTMVVAIGNLTDNKEFVEGGTGWAVEMAWAQGKETYVYDLRTGSWYFRHFWKNFKKVHGVPEISVHFAGIGTRELTRVQAEAIIRPLFEKAIIEYKLK
jgi:hypothetical protein